MALQGQSLCSCFSPTPRSQWSHPGVMGSVFICVESRSRARLYGRNPCLLQQTFGSGVQPDGVGRDSVGREDKEEEQGRDLGGTEGRQIGVGPEDETRRGSRERARRRAPQSTPLSPVWAPPEAPAVALPGPRRVLDLGWICWYGTVSVKVNANTYVIPYACRMECDPSVVPQA